LLVAGPANVLNVNLESDDISMPFIVVDEGKVASVRMTFLPKMAENQLDDR
jgi:hypothetical protein